MGIKPCFKFIPSHCKAFRLCEFSGTYAKKGVGSR